MGEIIAGGKAIANKIKVTLRRLMEWRKIEELPLLGPKDGSLRVLDSELIDWLKKIRTKTKES